MPSFLTGHDDAAVEAVEREAAAGLTVSHRLAADGLARSLVLSIGRYR
jgi:hypothetical protein